MPTATATRKFQLTMPGEQVVQKFYLDGDTAYALQMYGSNGKDMKLVSKEITSTDTEINFRESPSLNILLKNFGHGQTFEPFTDESDGSKWAWVATYASSTQEDSGGDYWATRIGVISLDNVDQIDASDVHAITYLNYLGTGSTKNLSLHRVDAALSSDKSRLAIWTQSSGTNVTSTKRVTALNAQELFTALKSGNVNAMTDSGMVSGGKYFVSSRDISGYSYPNDSWQGMELSNMTSNGYNWIYLTSGQSSDPITIVRSQWNMVASGNEPVNLTIESDLSDPEIEAPELLGDYVYFGLEEGDAGSKTHYIYTVPKSAF